MVVAAFSWVSGRMLSFSICTLIVTDYYNNKSSDKRGRLSSTELDIDSCFPLISP